MPKAFLKVVNSNRDTFTSVCLNFGTIYCMLDRTKKQTNRYLYLKSRILYKLYICARSKLKFLYKNMILQWPLVVKSGKHLWVGTSQSCDLGGNEPVPAITGPQITVWSLVYIGTSTFIHQSESGPEDDLWTCISDQIKETVSLWFTMMRA